jgi:hypothetical protein
MINYQARNFSDVTFAGFDSFEGLREHWSGMAVEKPLILVASWDGA